MTPPPPHGTPPQAPSPHAPSPHAPSRQAPSPHAPSPHAGPTGSASPASRHAVVTELALPAPDGFRVAACEYRAVGAPRARIVLAGATGVPQRFYRRFALHAAERGFTVTTLDYRGIGASRPTSLRGFEATFFHWTDLDLPTVVEHAARGDVPLHLVGHSFGGHAFGLLPNAAHLASAHLLGTGAGWHGWMPRREQFRVLAMWNLLGPALVRWKGYLNWSVVGLGADLPLGVYAQWKRWCRHPRYFFDDPEQAHLVHRFDRIDVPITAYAATDDRWSPPASRDAFMAGYRNAPLRTVDLDPRTAGFGPIGHLGYFRPAARPLWDRILTELAAASVA